jgi:polyisoprenoid-binding protein YceI
MMFINRKTLARSAIALPAALTLSTAALAEPRNYVVDDEHFSMFFEIMHIGYAPVMGMFRDVEGAFVYDEETRELKSGELVFQSDSVFTDHKKRDGHVRSDDFLDSEQYQEITFTVTGFETTGENTGRVTGDLELLGQTRPVVLDVTLNKADVYPFGHEEYTLGISASTTLKRSEWGMTYGIDQAMVGDEVKLHFGFEAIRESGWL